MQIATGGVALEAKKIPSEAQSGGGEAAGGRLVVVAEEPNAVFLFSSGSAETEAEIDSAVSTLTRKYVRLPSLSLPPSIPAAAEDEDDQNRKKVLIKKSLGNNSFEYSYYYFPCINKLGQDNCFGRWCCQG